MFQFGKNYVIPFRVGPHCATFNSTKLIKAYSQMVNICSILHAFIYILASNWCNIGHNTWLIIELIINPNWVQSAKIDVFQKNNELQKN